MEAHIKSTLALWLLTLTLAGAARPHSFTVQILDAASQIIATGDLSGHLTVSGNLASGRTLRISTNVGGVVTVRTFALAGTVDVTEAEAVRVQVGQQVLTLDSALETERQEAVTHLPVQHPDPVIHDATDDKGDQTTTQARDNHPAGDDHHQATPAPANSGATTPSDDQGGSRSGSTDDHSGNHSGSGSADNHGSSHSGGHH